MSYQRLTIQLETAQAKELEDLALRKERSVSYLVRAAVKTYLDSEGISVPISLGRNTRRALRRNAALLEATS